MMARIITSGACIIVLAAGLRAETSAGGFFSAMEKTAVKRGTIITRARLLGSEGFNMPAGKTIILPVSPQVPPALSGFEMLAEERAFMPCDMTPAKRLAVYNGLFSFSKFAGIRYYSRTDKKFLTYILASSAISAPGGQALADPVHASVERRRTGHFKIRDNRFGDITFRHEVIADGDAFIVRSTCVHSLSKMGFTIAGPEEYRLTSVYLYSAADRGFYYYGLHALRVRTGFFTSSGLLNAESFANRLRAETVRRAGLLGLDWTGKLRP